MEPRQRRSTRGRQGPPDQDAEPDVPDLSVQNSESRFGVGGPHLKGGAGGGGSQGSVDGPIEMQMQGGDGFSTGGPPAANKMIISFGGDFGDSE